MRSVRGADLHVPTVEKSVSLKLLEPSGPVQACNRITLPMGTGINISNNLNWDTHIQFYSES